MEETTKLTENEIIKRLKSDYPEDDKMLITLSQALQQETSSLKEENERLKKELKDATAVANRILIHAREFLPEHLKVKSQLSEMAKALELSNIVIDEAAGSLKSIPNVVAMKWSMCKAKNTEALSNYNKSQGGGKNNG